MSNYNNLQEAIRFLRERCDEDGFYTVLIPPDRTHKPGKPVTRTLWVANLEAGKVKVNIRRSTLDAERNFQYHVYNLGGELSGSFHWPLETIMEVRALLK